jgi:hypothetical protein
VLLTPWQVFERWVKERAAARNSAETWKYVFKQMTAAFEGRSWCRGVTPTSLRPACLGRACGAASLGSLHRFAAVNGQRKLKSGTLRLV